MAARRPPKYTRAQTCVVKNVQGFQVPKSGVYVLSQIWRPEAPYQSQIRNLAKLQGFQVLISLDVPVQHNTECPGLPGAEPRVSHTQSEVWFSVRGTSVLWDRNGTIIGSHSWGSCDTDSQVYMCIIDTFYN